MSKYYIVWNADKTEGFVTNDKQIAYEARKGSDTNCFDLEGVESKNAVDFCKNTSWHEDCTMQEVSL